ncbi:MAG: Topoisomerase 1-associated factor 1 [Geoglossum simile]|nr:MAG: Topoisomerase 1-associated factor 1 [Geoglossum simile]
METDDDSNAVVDPQVRAYVYSLISALGGTGADEDGRYVLGDDALACLKDLKRWLKLYDKKLNRLDVARCLAEGNLVNGDLLEILAAWSDEPMENRTKMKIALACLELLADLTWPIEKNDLQMTVNHHRHTPYLQVAQLSYKRSVLTHSTSKILRTIVRIGLPSVAQPMSERTSRDEDIIKLVLYFLRNIAMISTPRNLPIDGDEAEVSRSATISAFNDQDILHLLLTISSTMGEDFNTQDVVVLEVLFHLLKGVDVEKLFMNEKQLHAKHTNELQGLLTKELTFKREYAKNAPTRHNRFGSMIWIKRDEDRVSTVSGQDILLDEARSLDKLDKAKKWNKPRGRRGRGDELSLNDFDMPISLTPSANKHLRTFVEDFLDSAFNRKFLCKARRTSNNMRAALFSHIRKEIERERDRILDIHPRQFFYLIAWFLEAERMRHKVKLTSRSGKSVVGGGDDGFALIAGVLTQETFIILTRFLRESYDMKQWQDLNAGMRCFTEILLTVQQMAESPLEDDQEIAENIQNRLFYEETTHDLIILILRNYNDQGFGYLDACTELVHVHLRMLERYSKQNSDMQVRSRKRARRKRKTAKEGSSEGGVEDDDGDGESSAEDMAAAHRTSTERKFDFKRFAARFLSQSCTNTFVKFTSYYQELDAEQLKRAHRFFYRVAFKMEMSVMLFRVDIIALFVKMIKGPSGLDTSNPAWKEWDELVRQLIKKLVRKMGKRPELAVEMLFSKTNATAHFLEYGYTKQTVSTKIRAPAELEIKPGMVRDEQIGVAVAALLDQDKHDAVRWVKGALTSAFDERQSWETEAAAQVVEQENSPRNPPGITEKSTPSCPSISIRPDNGERRIAMFKDNKLRLLMKLVGFQRLGDEEDADATWIVPSSVTAAELKQCVDLIKKFENDPPVFDDDKVAADFIRRKQAPKARSSTFGDEDDDADFLENDEEEFLFPAGGPTNRKPDALKELKAKRRRRRRPKGSDDDEVPDEAELEARREKRQKTNLERMRAIKSDLYVHDSDDASDEEKDRMFFDKEAELRREHGKKVLEAMRLGAENGENPLGGGLNRKGRKRKSAGGDITTNDKIVNPSSKSAKRRKSAPPPRKTHRPSLFGHNSDSESTSSSPSNRDPDLVSLPSSDEGEKDTPLTSSPQVAQLSLSSHPNTEPPPLTKDRDGDIAMQDDGDDDEDIPAVRRRPRIGGFVVDSDSE